MCPCGRVRRIRGRPAAECASSEKNPGADAQNVSGRTREARTMARSAHSPAAVCPTAQPANPTPRRRSAANSPWSRCARPESPPGALRRVAVKRKNLRIAMTGLARIHFEQQKVCRGRSPCPANANWKASAQTDPLPPAAKDRSPSAKPPASGPIRIAAARRSAGPPLRLSLSTGMGSTRAA